MSLKDKLKNRIDDNKKENKKSGFALDTSLIEEEVKFFKPEEGRNRIDILPYTVTTDNHPQGLKKGDPDYILDIYVHAYIGLQKKTVLCLNRTYNKPCYICEQRDLFITEGNNKLADSLKPKRKAIYNIINCKNEEDGIQIFDTVHFFFEKELMDSLRAIENDEGGESIIFADLEEGKTICFRATKESFNKRSYLKFKDFSFKDRDEYYDEELINDTYSLDALLVVPTYEEGKNLLLGNTDESEEEEEQAPAKKPLKRKLKKKVKEDVDKVKNIKKTSDACPHGYKFGIDTDKKDECKECDIWETCADEYEKNKE